MTDKTIAERIVERLFTNGGTKQKPKRLVLEMDVPLNGAGWSKSAIMDVITDELARSRKKARGRY